MGKQFMRYGFGAILVYIAAAYGSDLGKNMLAGAKGVGTVVASFEGRNVNYS